MTTLNELTEHLIHLEQIDEALRDETEIEAEIADMLNAIAEAKSTAFEEFQLKVEAYLSLIRAKENSWEVRKKESDRLSKLAKQDENLAKKLKTRLLQCLLGLNIVKLETPKYNLSIGGSGGIAPLEISEISLENIPDEYKKTITEIDRQKIREALSSGEKLSFARLGERVKTLRIS